MHILKKIFKNIGFKKILIITVFIQKLIDSIDFNKYGFTAKYAVQQIILFGILYFVFQLLFQFLHALCNYYKDKTQNEYAI